MLSVCLRLSSWEKRKYASSINKNIASPVFLILPSFHLKKVIKFGRFHSCNAISPTFQLRTGVSGLEFFWSSYNRFRRHRNLIKSKFERTILLVWVMKRNRLEICISERSGRVIWNRKFKWNEMTFYTWSAEKNDIVHDWRLVGSNAKGGAPPAFIGKIKCACKRMICR